LTQKYGGGLVKKGLIIAFALLLLTTLSGCSSMAKVSWALTSPEESVGLTYANEDLLVRFTRMTSILEFEITNKASMPLKIVWDNCAFTGFDGNPSRIMHYGIRYLEKDRSMPPSMIPVGQTLKEGVTPVDNVMYLPYLGWTTFAELPISAGTDYYGKNFSFMMCYEIYGITKYENFSFLIGPPDSVSLVCGENQAVIEIPDEADYEFQEESILIYTPLPASAGICSVMIPLN